MYYYDIGKFGCGSSLRRKSYARPWWGVVLSQLAWGHGTPSDWRLVSACMEMTLMTPPPQLKQVWPGPLANGGDRQQTSLVLR